MPVCSIRFSVSLAVFIFILVLCVAVFILVLSVAVPKLVGQGDQYSAAGVQSAVQEVNAAAEKTSKALVAVGNEKMLVPKKAPTMPKPQWHAPWKLYRVSSYTVCCFARLGSNSNACNVCL